MSVGFLHSQLWICWFAQKCIIITIITITRPKKELEKKNPPFLWDKRHSIWFRATGASLLCQLLGNRWVTLGARAIQSGPFVYSNKDACGGERREESLNPTDRTAELLEQAHVGNLMRQLEAAAGRGNRPNGFPHSSPVKFKIILIFIKVFNTRRKCQLWSGNNESGFRVE